MSNPPELKNKPEDTPFKQQRLASFQPVYTPKSAAIIFFTASIVFYAFGFPIYVLSDNIKQFSVRYDDICKINSPCQITLDIEETIPEPVFVYYELTNFYQNHRLYVRSRSFAQLRDAKIPPTEEDLCTPAKYNKNFAGYYSETEKHLDPSAMARPCGMIARSVFNDTYTIKGYDVSDDDIVFENDKNMWKNTDLSKQWRDIDNHLIVWMKVAAFSDFRKLWGVIKKDVKKGQLVVDIENHYDVSEWNGSKRLVLSNASAFGGKNPVLGAVLISAGSFSIFCALVFTVSGIVFKHNIDEGDPRDWRY